MALALLEERPALAHAAGARHREEKIAEEAFGDFRRALDELLDLLVELREERASGCAHFQPAEDERVEEGRGRRPERTVRARRLQRLDRDHRGVHLAHRLAVAALDE